ncbi:MAG TPA: DUF1292 domain-containing protein [Syntrophomonadaceae bacterium]|nr:DUF1292 domain-containing protein [Syntrophomonadaceae bacterium]HNX27866.1 DUF1292 domain-containing protein [Syntrophomonadaceae bacterium]HPR93142.1 DUF1292 domain-containing protein [Syntrophomonadaceae bacterium]
MSDEELFDEEFPILILVDEEGEEHEFELLAELEIDDEKYRVLIPLTDEENEEEEEVEVVILKVVVDEEGNEFLSDIEDDDEWEKVADAWQELAESEDF